MDFLRIFFGFLLDNDKYKQIQELYSFGAFSLDVAERRLWRDDEAVQLAAKQFDLLVYLVENAGRIARKSDLLDAVWPDTYVEETTLARNISWLRKLLEDGENGERIIETVPKLGYRFTAEVTRSAPGDDLLIVEEQTVQHYRAEETLTITPDSPHEAARVEHQRPALRRFSTGQVLLLAFATILLTGTAFVAYQTFIKRQPAKPRVAANVTPLTTLGGFEDTPAFSPDGKFIAFSWNGGKGGEYGDKDIYIKAVKTGEPHQLTQTDTNEHYPVFSPDGLHIAFIRGKYGTPGELIIIPLLGGAERRVARVFSGNYSISFAPNGNDIAVVDTENSTDGGQYAIYLIDIKSGERRRVTEEAEFEGETTPRFSPDGRNIAFVRIASTADKQNIIDQDLFVVSAEGGKPEQLTFDRSGINSLAWDATGDYIYFVSHRLTNQLRVWSIGKWGGEPAIVSTGVKDVRNIALAPDGIKLVFSERNRRRSIWHVSAEGEPARKLIDSSNDQFYPQFSRDGSRVAFHTGFGEAGDMLRSDTIHVWLADADGGNPRQLTTETEAARNPQFSPDGSQVAFNVETDKGPANYTISTDGGGLRRISPAGWYDEFPVWSSDGEYIYFISKVADVKNIWRIRADGRGEPVQITKEGAYRAFPSPDGRSLFYIKEKFALQFSQNKEFPEHLWKVSTDGGGEEPLSEFAAAGFFGVFTVTPSGIYFLSVDADQKPKLKFYDPAKRTIKDAPGDYKLPQDIDREFIFKDVISVSGNALLCTVSTHTSRVMIADLQ